MAFVDFFCTLQETRREKVMREELNSRLQEKEYQMNKLVVRQREVRLFKVSFKNWKGFRHRSQQVVRRDLIED